MNEVIEARHGAKRIARVASLEWAWSHSRAQGYHKLTDGGKAEMSTRVWNGVRRKKYEFIELPDIVKEKDSS